MEKIRTNIPENCQEELFRVNSKIFKSYTSYTRAEQHPFQ